MKKGFTVLAVILVFAFAATAADYSKKEAFLGYTYVRTNSATDVPAFSANGGGGQFAYNFSRMFSAVADVGAVHNNNIGGVAIDNTTLNFLLGPRVSIRHKRLRPYFNVLFGGAYATASTAINGIAEPTPAPGVVPPVVPGQLVTARLTSSQTAFAMVAGGGLDVKINKHVSFRPIGLDYYMTRFQNLRSQNDNNQHNIRYTAGFNFTFGAL